VPIQPFLLQGSHRQVNELFRRLQYKHRRWVLAPHHYKDLPDLQSSFREKILRPIDEKPSELKYKKPLKMFIGYAPEAPEDTNMLKTLKRHLRSHLRELERMRPIEMWDEQNVDGGGEKGKEIERHLSEANIILLLLSPNFLASDECDIQMSMASERHKQAEATVIPILLRKCAWRSTPLLKELQPLPKNGISISERNEDDAFFEVSEGIIEAIKHFE